MTWLTGRSTKHPGRRFAREDEPPAEGRTARGSATSGCLAAAGEMRQVKNYAGLGLTAEVEHDDSENLCRLDQDAYERVRDTILNLAGPGGSPTYPPAGVSSLAVCVL